MTMQKTQGFSFLELLIAVVLLSTGLLGVAAMQISGLRYVHQAYLLSQATLLAQDIGERMRANQAAVGTKAYHLAHLTQDDPAVVSDSDCYTATGCTAGRLAHDDTRTWQQAISHLLPAGAGLVCIDSTPDDGAGSAIDQHQCDAIGDAYTVKIWWRENNNQDAPSRRYSLRIQP